MGFHPDSLGDLTGKVFIVTGGNSGIGHYTVARLAEHGAHVYLCARSTTKGNEAIASIKARYPNANLSLLEIDHTSLASVVAAAKRILSTETALHGLVNNAGIMATPFAMTEDGYEAQWQTNYLAHYVLTAHLLPLLLRTSKGLPPGSVRIVNVSSTGHSLSAPKNGINFDNTAIPDGDGMARYGQSKLANILHATTLHNAYGPGSASAKAGDGEIWTASLDPGLVATQLGAHATFPRWLKMIAAVYSALGGEMDPDTGSWTSVFCAASPTMTKEQSGTYFKRIAQAGSPSKLAQDPNLAVKLEEWTRKEMKRGGWIEAD